ncbi:alpha/beta hydrolase family protein [Shewanella aestuarii]|uniref:S9 family peptidase n=1 Tax=Shewanella aestuarii TaxID=1028752 RepID=A0A6G9QGP5_9GAMM|nr:S9 family peptidase [Shewanella aestuarii]QIR13237.1 S9 family peptidase [Shewanella aestuarii]
MKRILTLCWLLLALPILHLNSQTLPIEAFASIPDVSDITLSPDGKNIASVVKLTSTKEQGTLVTLTNVDTQKQTFVAKTDNQKYTVQGLSWASNDMLFIYAKFPATRNGTPVSEYRLFKYSVSEANLSSVIKPMVLKRFKWAPQIQSDIIDMLRDDDDHLLMKFNGLGNDPQYESVMRINLTDGRSSVVQYAEKNVYDWMTDRQHKVRIGIQRDETTYKILEQADNNEDLRTLWQFEAFAEDQVWPLGFGEDPNILYVQAYHNDFKAIFKVNLTDPKLTKELVFKRDDYDVNGGLIYSKVKQKVIGINDGADSEYTFWDPEYVGLVKGLDSVLPNNRNYITQFSEDERRYIVFSTSAVDSGTYYLGDRDQGTLLPIAYRYEKLLPEQMAKTKTINYSARDGLNIEGFLTTPLNAPNSAKLPAIIFPHGGPIDFDSNSFDYWTQYFANRGYAVLRMNFRGSSGYGYRFMKAGLKNWGLEMQTDVEDGARWLISEGIADPKRMCIAGASYGGYAALMAVATTKDLFQCAISFAGVADVEDLVKSHRGYTNFDIVKKQIGDDYDALYERSPVSKANNINVPVLLIHGEKDRSVDFEQSEDMYDALKKHKKPVEFVVLENGDHYLSDNADRLKAFRSIEAFLQQHLPVNKAAE